MIHSKKKYTKYIQNIYKRVQIPLDSRTGCGSQKKKLYILVKKNITIPNLNSHMMLQKNMIRFILLLF